MSLILVINCGSSSLKFAVLEPMRRVGSEPMQEVVADAGTEDQTLLSGAAEKLFEAQPVFSFSKADQPKQGSSIAQGHQAAMQALIGLLQQEALLERITAVGHRVVHGGEHFTSAARITPEVLTNIEACVPLAPLHNPANLIGIKEAMRAWPDLPQVAVFDTAFHQTMPERAFRYAIPEKLYVEHGVRRYGFHGTSHQFVAQQASRMLGKTPEQTGLVTAHLGNGCSVAAVQSGRSLDTSMGLTPLEGLVMGTRSGDVDPGLHGFLGQQLGWTLETITETLNQRSGLLGLSGLSNDCRELQEAQSSHAGAKLALEVFCYRLAKSIAAQSVALDHFDALVFTGGIGENSVFVRATTLGHLHGLGFEIDQTLNQAAIRGHQGRITRGSGRVALVVKTNEELMIAHQTALLTTSA